VTGALSVVRRRWWELGGLTEVVLALPWLWWSWLSIQFLRLFSDTAYWIVLVAWLVSAAAVLHPRTEELIAWRLHRLRPPSEMEMMRLGPAWWAVCTAAGVDPDRYRVWIHEGPEATAPATAGTTIAVTSWATLTLPPRNLEAVLAHELGHHLMLPDRVSLLLFWFTLPARAMGRLIMAGLRNHILKTPTRVVLGFFSLGVLIIWFFLGFSYYVAFMLSPFLAPVVVPWASRAAESYADRVAARLGYGVPLAEVFTGREYQRAQNYGSLPRTGKMANQPLDTARLRHLEKLLKTAPANNQQPQ
jgi:Zn-dependent protease with chaperone function